MVKFGRFEIPPRFPKKEESKKEETAFVPAERPAALARGLVIESPEQLEEAVGAYVDGINEYATQHDVFISGEKKALNAAKVELVGLSKELVGTENPRTRKKLENAMTALIDRINGELSDALQERVDGNESRRAPAPEDFSQSALEKHGPIRASQELGTPFMEVGTPEALEDDALPVDATRSESERALRKAVADTQEVTGHAADTAESNVVPFPKRPELSLTPEMRAAATQEQRHAQRAERAQKFAESYGLKAEYQELLGAEEAYADAVRAHHGKFFNQFKFREDAATNDARERLNDAARAWRESLSWAGEEAQKKGEQQDWISARFLSAREAMIPRAERARQQAVQEGLDERSKTAFGKLEAWAKQGGGKALGAAGTLARIYGTAAQYAGGWAVGRFIDKETDPEKYRRASRIIGSSLIMTAIFAPAGAALAGAAGTALAWRIGRGFFGWGLGAAAGKGSGKAYDWIYGSEEARKEKHEVSQRDLKALLKGTDGAFENAEEGFLAETYKKGSEREFAKQEQEHARARAHVELATSTLVAGASAYGISHWHAVHEAAQTLQPGGQAAPEAASTHAQTVHHAEASRAGTSSAEAVHAAAPTHVESVSVGGSVNDADKLLGRFMTNVQHQFPNPHDAPPALRKLLEQYHADHGMHEQDVLTRFLKLQDGGSASVHAGDTISFDGANVLMNSHVLVDNTGMVHSLSGLHFEHIQPQEAVHHATERATNAPESQQVTPQSAPKIVPQPEPAQPVQPRPVQPAPAAAPIATPPPAAQAFSPEGPSIIPSEPSHHAPTHVEAPAPPEAPQQPVPPETLSPIGPTIVPHEAPVPSNDNEPLVPEHSTEAHTLVSPPWSIDHAFTNPHGVLVDPKAAHIYESSSVKGYGVIWGGSNEQRDALIQKFYADPKNETKVLMYISPEKSLLTGQHRVGFWSSAGVQVNSVGRFKEILPPGLDTFTKIVE